MEERQAEHLRQESEAFLAKQMEEMQGLVEEQRKAGKLLLSHENGGPVKLSIGGAGVSAAHDGTSATGSGGAAAAASKAKVQAKASAFATAFANDDDDDEGTQKKKATLVKIDFGGIDADSKKERLEKIRASIKTDKDSLFKHKIRWDGISDVSVLSWRFLSTNTCIE